MENQLTENDNLISGLLQQFEQPSNFTEDRLDVNWYSKCLDEEDTSTLKPHSLPQIQSEDDVIISNLFPKTILRAEKDVYLLYKTKYGIHLNNVQTQRLRQLRRKERSCVYANKARRKRINEFNEKSEEIKNLKKELNLKINENRELHKQLDLLMKILKK